VLVDDELIHAFYDALVPQGIHTGAAFERWYRDEQKKEGNEKLLFLSRDDLMRHEAAGVTTDLFPKRMTMSGRRPGTPTRAASSGRTLATSAG